MIENYFRKVVENNMNRACNNIYTQADNYRCEHYVPKGNKYKHMKNGFYQTLILLFIINSSIFAQNSVLAKIGNTAITDDEFKIRYEFTPKVKAEYDSSRVNFLYTLIAEKLWSLEAESLSMDTSQYVKNSLADIERKLVRDKLYKLEIESKINISEKEISEALPWIKEKRIMKFLFSKNKNEIISLYKKLRTGVNFDSLLIGRREEKQQVNGVPVIYGQMDDKLEKKIFSLKIHQYSKPIPVQIGWVIYYVNSIEDYVQPTADNIEGNRKFVKETIFNRKAKGFYKEFFDKYIKGNSINADKSLFNRVVNELFLVFSSDEQDFYNKYKKKFELDTYKLKSIRKNFSSKELSSIFIKFKSHPISLGQYLNNLELNSLFTDKRSKYAISKSLNTDIKDFIFEELLVREGYSRNLQDSEDIKKDMNLWKSSFMASYYKYSFLDSVEISNTDSKNFYEKIVSESKDSIKQSYKSVKEKIERGLYFKELENIYIDTTVYFAKKYKISVNKKLLNSIQLTNIEMMVFRKLGFGGEISAVPYAQAFYKWKNWLPKSIKQTLP